MSRIIAQPRQREKRDIEKCIEENRGIAEDLYFSTLSEMFF